MSLVMDKSESKKGDSVSDRFRWGYLTCHLFKIRISHLEVELSFGIKYKYKRLFYNLSHLFILQNNHTTYKQGVIKYNYFRNINTVLNFSVFALENQFRIRF